MRIGIKSLGCPRNLVDTEVICGKLKEKGHKISGQINNSDLVIINTCSFIKDAVEESNHTTPRTVLTPQHYAYIKISEGCQNNCSYCLIPKIRGNYRNNDDLIEVIANYPRICPYLDLPLQHISDKILKNMNRPIDRRYVIDLINKLRDRIPNLALRTTFIVGFPGETDKDFGELLSFIKEIRFERLGAFIFSKEEGIPAFNFSQQIPIRIKKERLEKLMIAQQKISKEINSSYQGKEMVVLVDEITSGKSKLAIGRTQADAPEIDGKVIIKTDKVEPGKFIKVNIVETSEYDLVGEIKKQ